MAEAAQAMVLVGDQGSEELAEAEIQPDCVAPMEALSLFGASCPEVERIIGKVSCSGSTVRSQQRGDPDLTDSQKTEILSQLLHRSPGDFLRRYGSLLGETDLNYFESLSDGGYEVQFRIQELRRNLDPRVRQKRTRNRRFECLKELIETTQYFSEEEMRHRNPLLYEHYIGQYLTEEEREALDMDKSDMTLSGHILHKMETDRRRELLRFQRQREAEQVEESDSNSDEEEGGEGKGSISGLRLSGNLEVAAQEKAMLRREFMSAMQMSFLNGEDKEFDYTKVDLDERYDSMDLRGRDDESSYFDAEEPSWCGDGADREAAGTLDAGGDMDTGDSSDNDYMSDKYLLPPSR